MTREIIPLFQIPSAEDLPPEMQECTVGERAAVIWKIETGAANTECTRMAGYSTSSPDVLKATAYGIFHKDRVQAALLAMSRKLMRTEGPKSIKTLVEIRDNAKADDKDRIKASVELLNRANLGAIQEGHLTVTHELNEAQLDQQILSLAAQLGMPREIVERMLIAPADFNKNADVVDAEFEVVEPAEPKSPEAEARTERYFANNENEKRKEREAMSPEELAAHKAAQLEIRRQIGKAKYEAAQNPPDEPEIPEWLKELL